MKVGPIRMRIILVLSLNKQRRKGALIIYLVKETSNLDKDLSYNPEKQLYRTLANNHVLPRWIELSKEIDDLKEKLKENTNTAEAADLIRTINKRY